MKHASLFSGIGGPEVAATMLGWENVFHCEINPFGRAVLDYWFPESQSYEDITKTDFTKYRGRIDVLTGGFPCQPFSYAGKRGGQEDDRYLWPEMLRVIDEIRPTWVVGENVAGIATMVESCRIVDMGCEASLFEEDNGICRFREEQSFTIERVCKDLESKGYSVQPVLIPATAVGAWHRRDRIFFIAHNTDSCHDMRESGEHEGKSRTERICQRNEVRFAGKPGDVRSEAARAIADTKGNRGEKYTNTYNPKSQMGQSLSEMAGSGMLPTPSARDWKGRTNPGVVKEGSGCIYGETLPDAVERITSCRRKDGKPFRLSPLFSEEMMGFPLMWTTLPFLSQNGETSQ